MPDNKRKKSIKKSGPKNKSSISKKKVVLDQSKATNKVQVNNKKKNEKLSSVKNENSLKNISISKKNVAQVVDINNKSNNTSLKKVNQKNSTNKRNSKKIPKFSTVTNIKIETKDEVSVLKKCGIEEKKSLINKFTSFISKKNKSKNVNSKRTKAKNTRINNKKVKINKKDSVFNNKIKRIFIIVSVICLIILLLEGIYLIIYKNNIDNNKIYYDTMNSLTIDDTDIVAVGSSNFNYSKYYDYTGGLEKGKFIKYDKDGKILVEKMYETGINTTFSSIITVEDGYIVVGSGVFSKEEQENGAKEALIIKYDKDGNIVWEKFYQVVTNTSFNKVIEVNDGYVAVGQSIYANTEMGNHTTGGGIIVKYDKEGKEIWHNNHGGMKSGNFNDVVEVDGNLYVVGKDATDSGNIVKYTKDGKYVWHKNYSYTDGIGFTGIAYLNKSLYVVGSKKILPEDITEEDSRSTTNTDALLVVYDMKGNIEFEKTFGGSNYERYNSILAHRNNLYVVGNTSSNDAGLKIDTDGKLMTGLVVRYDVNGNILKKDAFGGSNNDILTDITTDGVCLFISGYSNSNDGNITTAINNGKDYFGKIIEIDFKFRTLMVK